MSSSTRRRRGGGSAGGGSGMLGMLGAPMPPFAKIPTYYYGILDWALLSRQAGSGNWRNTGGVWQGTFDEAKDTVAKLVGSKGFKEGDCLGIRERGRRPNAATGSGVNRQTNAAVGSGVNEPVWHLCKTVQSTHPKGPVRMFLRGVPEGETEEVEQEVEVDDEGMVHGVNADGTLGEVLGPVGEDGALGAPMTFRAFLPKAPLQLRSAECKIEVIINRRFQILNTRTGCAEAKRITTWIQQNPGPLQISVTLNGQVVKTNGFRSDLAVELDQIRQKLGVYIPISFNVPAGTSKGGAETGQGSGPNTAITVDRIEMSQQTAQNFSIPAIILNRRQRIPLTGSTENGRIVLRLPKPTLFLPGMRFEWEVHAKQAGTVQFEAHGVELWPEGALAGLPEEAAPGEND